MPHFPCVSVGPAVHLPVDNESAADACSQENTHQIPETPAGTLDKLAKSAGIDVVVQADG